ncbi:amidohydrolase [Arthrobacter halodurans]|uniref:Amidohydrolase n=1 Tax=Arthrobacter halodurans TaxID=516699 RepID=A0ABV4UUU7_9MICC
MTNRDGRDLVLLTDTVHTLDADTDSGAERVQAVLVRHGVVAELGDRRRAKAWAGGGAETIDLGKSTLTPGLVDGHLHPVMGLTFSEGHDLSGVASLEQLTRELRRAAADDSGKDGWISCWGLDPNVFGGNQVHNALLEDAAPHRPVFIRFSDAHSGLASTAALRRAGVTGPVAFDQAAEVVCDETGTPTGQLLEDAAVNLVFDHVPRAAPADRRARLARIFRDMAATGLVGAHVMDFEEDSGELLASLDGDGALALRLRCAPFCFPGVGTEELDEFVALQRRGGRDWKVDGVKFMIDGTIDGGTAWLQAPDSHGESTAPFWPDPHEYAWAVRHLAEAGVPTATHAIGDAGVRFALETLAGAARTRTPHRIEHIETIPDDLVPLFARHRVTASMQPTHCTHYTAADHSDNWSERLGTERANRAFRTRDLRDAGAVLALGSDWPVAPYDARAVLADAQLRRPAGRPDVDPVLPGQSLTARMALEGYTTMAAAAAGETGRAGRIAVGQRADFTAFTVDPLAAPPDELAEAPIALTVLGGRVTHRSVQF